MPYTKLEIHDMWFIIPMSSVCFQDITLTYADILSVRTSNQLLHPLYPTQSKTNYSKSFIHFILTDLLNQYGKMCLKSIKLDFYGTFYAIECRTKDKNKIKTVICPPRCLMVFIFCMYEPVGSSCPYSHHSHKRICCWNT